MNPIATLFSLLLSTSSILHDIVPTKIVKDGTLAIQTSPLLVDGKEASEVEVKIHYDIHTSWWAPVHDQSGDLLQNLPIKFTNEEGYLELEREGHEVFKNVDLYYLGRVDDNEFKNAHKIRVVKQDGSWEAIAYYHPSIASTGWTHMELTLKKVPALGEYTLISNLRR